MEPATHDDLWQHWLPTNGTSRRRVIALVGDWLPRNLLAGEDFVPRADQLVTNLAYATAMCRVHYYRVPARLPPADDLDALGQYWKQYYNTPADKGSVAQFVEQARRVAG